MRAIFGHSNARKRDLFAASAPLLRRRGISLEKLRLESFLGGFSASMCEKKSKWFAGFVTSALMFSCIARGVTSFCFLSSASRVPCLSVLLSESLHIDEIETH